jgi:hypothetical protein
MGAVEACPDLSGVRDPGAYAGRDLLIGNMSQMPLHEFSWGRNLGTVHTLRSLDKVKVIGWVAICPRLPDGGLEILTCLEPDTGAAETQRGVHQIRWMALRRGESVSLRGLTKGIL